MPKSREADHRDPEGAQGEAVEGEGPSSARRDRRSEKKSTGKSKLGSADHLLQEDLSHASLESDTTKLKRKDYEKRLTKLHAELVKLQEWVRHEQRKVCIIFEGRDGAGKGGTIKAITARVSPRVFRIIALPAPTERQKSQMYIQRYISHLPAGGEVVIFDRSWYNRAGVERVMKFCSEKQSKRFLEAVPGVEKAIVESGVILLKYWLEVGPKEQTKRLEARIDDDRKIWKLSKMDLESYSRWDDYTKARDDMFLATDSAWAPWFVARSDDKRRARLNIIEHLLSQVPYKDVPREKIKLPKRQVRPQRKQIDHPLKFVPEVY